ncbi:MAG: hypothetical protein ACOYOJ_21115 [Alsobacter sp.]
MLWIPFTLIAAAAQTARNAMQRELTATLGTVGATHVRFLFGFPFAILFLIGVLAVTGAGLPTPSLIYWPWITLGFVAQIVWTPGLVAARGTATSVAAAFRGMVGVAVDDLRVGLAFRGLDRVGDKPLTAVELMVSYGF